MESLPADATFDLVCAFEVIEHIEDDRAALATWVSHVAPGGSLLLSTPADPERYGVMDEAVGHFRRYEPDALAGLLRAAGLVDVRLTLYGAPLSYVLEMGHEVIGRRMKRREAADAATTATERAQRSMRGPTGWSSTADSSAPRRSGGCNERPDAAGTLSRVGDRALAQVGYAQPDVADLAGPTHSWGSGRMRLVRHEAFLQPNGAAPQDRPASVRRLPAEH